MERIEADKKRVECQAPWNIDGYHLILKKPRKNQLPRGINFSTTNFWVQAHNLPLEYILKENAIIIGNSMGKFMEADLAGVVLVYILLAYIVGLVYIIGLL